MKTNRRSRPASKLPHLRWTSYAIAAGATAAGAIPAAEAAIHYSGPVDYKFNHESTFKTHKFPLSNGAHLVGALNNVDFLGYHYAGFGVVDARVSNSLRGPGRRSGLLQLSALPVKSVVSNGNFFPTPFYSYAFLQSGDCINPDWQEAGIYYVGFRFNTGAGPQYGWVRIRWSGCPENKFIVKDYAWGDPGDRIKTGQRQQDGDSQFTPPPAESTAAAPSANAQGSLGLLALGAVGLRAWRAARVE